MKDTGTESLDVVLSICFNFVICMKLCEDFIKVTGISTYMIHTSYYTDVLEAFSK